MAKKCVAMLLAGGQGARLGVFTHNMAKPAVPFGGKYKIIDFTLSNCVNSNIDTVGVLTQYKPMELNSYIGSGQPWDLDRNSGGIFVLPPYMDIVKGEWYKGTANAIYQNVEFIEQFSPKYVLILSGDHIYKMNYSEMIKFHETNEADVTIAAIKVPPSDAPRFGILEVDDDYKVTEFQEKPKNPKSNLASMGVYVFSWPVLKHYLCKDEQDPQSSNDFGKDIIPKMIDEKKGTYAFPFDGYWKDVGTIHSMWEANMDLLSTPPKLNLYDSKWRIYSRNMGLPPHYMSYDAVASESLVTEGCVVHGTVKHSILSAGVEVGEGSYIEDSLIMPNAVIGKNVRIEKAIVGTSAVIGDGCVIGEAPLLGQSAEIGRNEEITLISGKAVLAPGTVIYKGCEYSERGGGEDE